MDEMQYTKTSSNAPFIQQSLYARAPIPYSNSKAIARFLGRRHLLE